MFRRMLVLLMFAAATAAGAQTFPSQPIRIVIPYAPGGGSDILARPVSIEMGARLKQPVFIDNKGGAGGNIGTQLIAHAAPDGYNLLLANNSQAVNPFIYKSAGYDMEKDFAPITLLGTSPVIVVVNKSLGISTLREFVALAKKSPGKLNFGSPGVGTPGHLATLLFNKQAGIDLVHIAYKGSGPTAMALLQKEVDVFFGTPAVVESFIKSGDFKALAVTSKKRFPSFPTVPSVAELGIPGVNDYEIDIWWGLLAPAKTDPAILDKLHEAAVAAVKDPRLGEKWLSQGMVPTVTSRAEFAAIIKADLVKWEKIVKDNRITLE